MKLNLQISQAAKQFKLIFSLLLASAIPFEANAIWSDVISPPNGFVKSFTIAPSSPSTIFTTNTGANNTVFGVWRSIDSGANWEQVSSSSIYQGVAVKPNDAAIVLAGAVGVTGQDVERSVLSGDIGSWVSTSGSASNQEQWIFAFSASSPATVYSAGFVAGGGGPDTGKLQKSINSGGLWQAISSVDGDANPVIYSIAVDPTTPDTVYVGANPTGNLNDGLYKSTDGGANWINLTNTTSLDFTAVDAIAVDPNNSQIVYVGTNGFGLIKRSLDGGSTWETVHDPAIDVVGFSRVSDIAIDPDNSSIIYAVGGNGATKVIVSTNCGQTWQNVPSTGITSGLPTEVEIDTVNSIVYVVEKALTLALYSETAESAATGTCPVGGGAVADLGGGSGGGAFELLIIFGLLMTGVRAATIRARKA